MTVSAVPLLAALPDWAFGFVLVLARIGLAVAVLPGFGESEFPATVRAGLAVGISVILLPVLGGQLPAAGVAPFAALALVAHEVAIGLLLGWPARLLVTALPVTGQVVALQIGLSSVLQPDPELGAQTSATARLLSLAGPLLILATGGLYALPLRALVHSYAVFPPVAGGLPAGDAAAVIARATENCFATALQLAAPLLVAGLVWQGLLGTLARLVPSLQVFNLSMPGQVLGGLLLFALSLAPMLEVWLGGVADGFALLPGSGAR